MKDTTVVTNFINITKFPLDTYLSAVDTFFTKSYPRILNFYNGKVNNIAQSDIKFLSDLIISANSLSTQFKINKNRFKTVDFWNLLDLLEDIRTKLETTSNLSKYVRSSINNSQVTKGIQFDLTLNNGQTLEAVSKDVLKQTTFENSWVDIALSNDLREIDYDTEGGSKVTLVDNSFQTDLVTSMIDNTVGEKVYGLDVDRNISFEDNDLKTLSYRDTAFQAVEILSQLSQGDIPEFPGEGLNNSLFRGANFNQVQWASIIRQLNKNFTTDDLFIDFQVTKMKYEEGDLFVEFRVGTKYDLVIVKNITL